jgi:hypothetical protein
MYHSRDNLIGVFPDKTRPRKDGLWIAIDQAFATPVNRDDETKEYIPTQIIAELFKSEGFDGIVYKSLLTEHGFNLALFNLGDASVVRCGLCKVSSIGFHFQEVGNEYFAHDDGDAGS